MSFLCSPGLGCGTGLQAVTLSRRGARPGRGFPSKRSRIKRRGLKWISRSELLRKTAVFVKQTATVAFSLSSPCRHQSESSGPLPFLPSAAPERHDRYPCRLQDEHWATMGLQASRRFLNVSFHNSGLIFGTGVVRHESRGMFEATLDAHGVSITTLAAAKAANEQQPISQWRTRH